MKYLPETTLDHVVIHIKANYRNQSAAASAWGISPGYLSAVLHGQRPIPAVVLDAIGLEWRLVPKSEQRGTA